MTALKHIAVWDDLLARAADRFDMAEISINRREISEKIREFQDIHSGARGDAVIGVRQRDWWALLDLAALQSMRSELVREVAKQLSDRVTDLEDRLAAAGPSLKFAGVYQRTSTYQQGDVVTHAGSAWVALAPVAANASPGNGEARWQLMVKRGRDGKDADASGGQRQ